MKSIKGAKGNQNTIGDSRYISDVEAANILGVAVQTLRNWRATGKGPAYTKVSNRLVRYYVSDLYNFMEKFRITPGQAA